MNRKMHGVKSPATQSSVLLTALAVFALAPRVATAQDAEEFLPPEGGEDFVDVEGGDEEGDFADEPEEARPVKVAVFIFPEVDLDARVATELVAGLRRGIRADDRLVYVDPSKALQSEDVEEESEQPSPSEQGLDLLERAIGQVAAGAWRRAARTLDDVIENFENDLNRAPRRALVDATMLWGAAQCKMRRTRVCRSAFRRVVTFRENAEYDTEILPAGLESIFEEIRDETLGGPRGSLRIETEPPGAEVFVDGRFVGAAPTQAEGLLAGDHYVTLKMAGYHRQVNRVTVQTDFEDTANFELLQMDNAPLLRDALRSARNEMGQTRVGGGMRDLWSLLLIDQVVLGDLSRVGDTEEFNLTLYLYDLRTNFGLRRLERRLDWIAMDLPSAEILAADLYRDVDLTGRIRPVPEDTPAALREPDPFYRTWWFWSIVGVVVVGTTIGVASAAQPRGLPEGVGELVVPF